MNIAQFLKECRLECRQNEIYFKHVNFTKPYVYISPKLNNKHGSYKPKAGEVIRVCWSHFHPEKNKKIEIKKSHGIKNFETFAEQKRFARALCNAYYKMLKAGYNPFNTLHLNAVNKPLGLLDALEISLKDKKQIVEHNTFKGYNNAVNHLKKWLQPTNYKLTEVKSDLVPVIIDQFFASLREQQINPTSYNNIRANLSPLFKVLQDKRQLNFNPVTAVPKLKSDPTKNKAYTAQQIKENTQWLAKNDPELQFYIQCFAYSFLRPRELVQVRLKDIDLENNVLRVKTKSQKTETVPIIKQLQDILKPLRLDKLPGHFYLITTNGEPGPWDVKPEQKTRVFSQRFKELKKIMSYGNNYSLYSYRHVIAMNIYKSFELENLTVDEIHLKMKEITRHKSIAGLKNYLKGTGAHVAGDYGSRITLEL